MRPEIREMQNVIFKRRLRFFGAGAWAVSVLALFGIFSPRSARAESIKVLSILAQENGSNKIGFEIGGGTSDVNWVTVTDDDFVASLTVVHRLLIQRVRKQLVEKAETWDRVKLAIPPEWKTFRAMYLNLLWRATKRFREFSGIAALEKNKHELSDRAEELDVYRRDLLAREEPPFEKFEGIGRWLRAEGRQHRYTTFSKKGSERDLRSGVEIFDERATSNPLGKFLGLSGLIFKSDEPAAQFAWDPDLAEKFDRSLSKLGPREVPFPELIP